MYHLMDALVEHPMPEGFFVRKFRKGEEAIWIEINKCGIFGPDAGMEGWESMVVKMNGIVPERDILFLFRLCRSDFLGNKNTFKKGLYSRFTNTAHLSELVAVRNRKKIVLFRQSR